MSEIHATAGPVLYGKRFVGQLTPHDVSLGVRAAPKPYMTLVSRDRLVESVFGSAQFVKGAPTYAQLDTGPVFPMPSPNEFDAPYIAFLQTTRFPKITMNEWNDVKRSMGKPINREFIYRRQSKRLRTDDDSVVYTTKNSAQTIQDYVEVLQRIVNTRFKTLLRRKEWEVMLMRPGDEVWASVEVRAATSVADRRIKFRPEYMAGASEASILETALHEIAHAVHLEFNAEQRKRIDATIADGGVITPADQQAMIMMSSPDKSHNWFWQQICFNIGSDGTEFDTSFPSMDVVMSRERLFTCTQPNDREPTCVVHIDADARSTYDDRASNIVDVRTGRCTRHGASFVRVMDDVSTEEGVEMIKTPEGLVGVLGDYVDD